MRIFVNLQADKKQLALRIIVCLILMEVVCFQRQLSFSFQMINCNAKSNTSEINYSYLKRSSLIKANGDYCYKRKLRKNNLETALARVLNISLDAKSKQTERRNTSTSTT